jgi:four helix bundle protein
MAKTGKIQEFEDLIAWQKSKKLSVMVYHCTETGQFSRDFALKDQIRRAVISVMSNIAEGFERHSPKEFQHFLSIARGSAAEVRSQIQLAVELGYINEIESRDIMYLCVELRRIIGGLRSSLNIYI